MASTISAGTTSGTAIAIAGDTTGALALQTNNGTTAVTISTAQSTTLNSAASTAPLITQINGTEALRVDSSGNLIGNALTSSVFQMGVNTTGKDVRLGVLSGGNGRVEFYAAGSELMRLSSAGDFLVGGTSTIGSNGNLLANADYTATYRSTTNTGAYVHAFASDIGGTRTVKYAIYANGTAGAVSDQNLKKNIEPARNYLTDLMNIEVVKYNWKSDEENAPKELGYIAQQVETVFAGMIDEQTYKDGDGNLVTQKMLKKEVFIPMMLKAIQELNAKVDAQAITIAELQARTT